MLRVLLALVLMVGVAHAATNKFYRAGECYKIEYRKYQKIPVLRAKSAMEPGLWCGLGSH